MQASTVVGYETKNTIDTMKIMTPTFESMSTVRKMGDLKPTTKYEYYMEGDFDSSTFFLNFYNGQGSQRLLADDPWIMANCPQAATDYPTGKVQIYWDDMDKVWYLTCDADNKRYPMTNYPLASGAGFLENVSSFFGTVDETEDNPGVELTFSGSVDKLPIPLKAIDTMILTGNMTPAPVKLSETTVYTEYEYYMEGDFDSSTFFLNFYNGQGSQRLLADDPWIMANCPQAATDYPTGKVQIYWDDMDKVWYLTCDADNKNYPMTNFVINPGDGFLMNVSSFFGTVDEVEDNPGVTMLFPSAIED